MKRGGEWVKLTDFGVQVWEFILDTYIHICIQVFISLWSCIGRWVATYIHTNILLLNSLRLQA